MNWDLQNADEVTICAMAVEMWANWIQSGDPVLSSGDLERMGRHKQIKALSEDQMRFVLRLKDLARNLRNG